MPGEAQQSYKRPWNQTQEKVGEKEPVPEHQRGVLAQGEVLRVGTALLLVRLEGSQHPRRPSLGWESDQPKQSDPEGPGQRCLLTTMQHQLVYEVGTFSVVTPNKDFNME